MTTYQHVHFDLGVLVDKIWAKNLTASGIWAYDVSLSRNTRKRKSFTVNRLEVHLTLINDDKDPISSI